MACERENQSISYGEFKVHASKLIPRDDLLEVCTACDLKRGETDSIMKESSNTLRFLEFLEERGKISEDSIQFLCVKLRNISLDGVADELCKLFEKTQRNKNVLEGIGRDDDATFSERKTAYNQFLQHLGLHMDKRITLTESMQVRSNTLNSSCTQDTEDCPTYSVLSRLSSYDHRIEAAAKPISQLLKGNELSSPNISIDCCKEIQADSQNVGNDNANSDSEYVYSDDEEDEKEGNQSKLISLRDALYGIISNLDPFLLQEMLSKMSACQMAVPLLLPNPVSGKLVFLLWGLRKIVKSWYNHSTKEIQTANVVSSPFLAVTAIRLGSIKRSKSNVLNKLLGPAQGNDTFSHFLSNEDDPCQPTWSKGVLEVVWFLPNDEIEENRISKPFALLNLRGNAYGFESQVKFATNCSFATIVFVDSEVEKAYKEKVELIKNDSHVILVKFGGSRSMKNGYGNKITKVATYNDTSQELSRQIGKILAKMMMATDLKTCLLEDVNVLSGCSHIEVDESNAACVKAKNMASDVVENVTNTSKEMLFPIQGYWKKWIAENFRKSFISSDIEGERAKRSQMLRDMREKQFYVHDDATTALTFYKGLSLEATERQYFLEWMYLLLYDVSVEKMKQISTDLSVKSQEKITISKQIGKTSACIESDPDGKGKLDELIAQESNIVNLKENLIKQFDESYIGIEHFFRELVQLSESSHFLQTQNHSIPVQEFPNLAAKLLLSGYPIELLDGDANNVPVLWLRQLFTSLQNITKHDCKVYVISILGVQSSGKSTLLNAMFGARFPVSAGRCTRGAFLHLLPVHESIKAEIDCDFIVIIDTEGLKAPEKLSSSTATTMDNELATFALCISDLTLINIGGQIVGEDMTNILQIAAHAFIRMKEVQLQSQCRIVQQFVADVTAKEKNESATQSIVLKLDEAIQTAADSEGKLHLYRQFTDVFTLQNFVDDANNIQYIPSLWRGYMDVPNCQYSVSVNSLKSIILQGIKQHHCEHISYLGTKIEDVWYAISKEDFVFSFQNTREATMYEKFLTLYRKWLVHVRAKVSETRLSAQMEIKRATDNASAIEQRKTKVVEDILTEECALLRDKISETMKGDEYNCIRKHETFFQADLKSFETNILESLRKEFINITCNLHIKKAKELILIEITDKLRENAAVAAKKLRRELHQTQDNTSSSKDTRVALIQEEFKRHWGKWVTKLKEENPLQDFDTIKGHFLEQIYESIQADTRIAPLNVTNYMNCDLSTFSTSYSYMEFTTYKKAFQTAFHVNESLNLMAEHDCKYTEHSGKSCHVDIVRNSLIETIKKGGYHDFSKKEETDIKQELSSVSNTIFYDEISTLNATASKKSVNFDRILKHIDGTEAGFRHQCNFKLKKLQSESDNFCSSATIKAYAEYVAKHLKDFKTNEKKIACVKYAIITGVCRFHEYHINLILNSTNESCAHRQRTQSVDFLSLDRKIDEVLRQFNETTYEDEKSQFQKEFSSSNLKQLYYMSSCTKTLQLLDLRFSVMLPNHSDLHMIQEKLNDAKSKLMNDRSYMVPFNTTDFAGILAELTNTFRLQKCKNEVCAAAIFHFSSWVFMRFTDILQEYENSQNIATVIKKEKDILCRHFQNLCSDQEDKIVAEEFCVQILQPFLLDSVIVKMLPIVITRISNKFPEFLKKSTFIGKLLERHVDDYRGILEFLQNFQNFGTQWTLHRIAELCNEEGSSLLLEYAETCLADLILQASECIKQCQETLQRDNCTIGTWIWRYFTQFKDRTDIDGNSERNEKILQHFLVRNFDTFSKECLSLVANMKSLLPKLDIPPPGNIKETKQWLQKVNPNLHVDLFKNLNGCDAQCPFCGIVCDYTLTEHVKHSATMHCPRGLKGTYYERSGKLVPLICTSAVESNRGYYKREENFKKLRLFKHYEKEYPDWYIRGDRHLRPIVFWQYIFVQFNEEFAEFHNRQSADVPREWKDIKKEEALKSLREVYHI